MSSNNKPILYSYWRSSCSWRVRLALAIKDLDYEYEAVNLLKAEQLSDEYRKINPMNQVPALSVNKCYLTQSVPIIEYLDEVYSQQPLLPKDPLDKAKVRALTEMIASGIQPVQNLAVGKYASQLAGSDVKGQWNKHFITKGFQALEKALKDTSGQYCFGDEVTLADICLVPQVYNAKRWNVDMSEFPLISKIDEGLSVLPAFIAAHPDNQPDAPSNS